MLPNRRIRKHRKCQTKTLNNRTGSPLLNFNQLSRGGRRQVSRKVRVRVEGIKVLVRIKENLRELNNI
jgi:hypothetical protein